MEILATRNDKGTIVAISGKMDAVTAPVYEQKLRELIDGGETVFVNDFSRLAYISSAGLRSILATAKILKPKQGTLMFCGLTGPVRDVFEISGFGSLFPLHPSPEAALKSIG